MDAPHGNARVQLADGPVGQLVLSAALLRFDPVPEADLTVVLRLPLHGDAGPHVQILTLGVHCPPDNIRAHCRHTGRGKGGQKVEEVLLGRPLEVGAHKGREAGSRHREDVTSGVLTVEEKNLV